MTLWLFLKKYLFSICFFLIINLSALLSSNSDQGSLFKDDIIITLSDYLISDCDITVDSCHFGHYYSQLTN